MLVNDGDRVCKHLCRGLAVSILVRGKLRLMVAQLIQQAIAQVAAGHAGRIHLAHQLQGFMQIGKLKLGWNTGCVDFRGAAGSARRSGGAGRATASGAGGDATASAADADTPSPSSGVHTADDASASSTASLHPDRRQPQSRSFLKTFSAMVASTSGGAGGATPSSSSSLAIR